LLVVPSVIIAEEHNVLINPAHPDAKRITATKVRRFVYDHRV
jgi:RES domain-containing protein